MNSSAVLRIAVAQYEPLAYACAQMSKIWDPLRCPLPGIDFEILVTAAKILGIEYEVVPIPEPVDWGKPSEIDDQYTGMLGMIQNDQIDTIAAVYGITENRKRNFDFSHSVQYQANKPGFIMHRQGRHLDIQAYKLLYNTLSPPVWGWFFGLYVALSLIIFGTSNFKEWINGKEFHGFRQVKIKGLWISIQLLIDQYHEEDDTIASKAGSIAMVVLGFLILYFEILFEGMLVASLVTQTDTPPFGSMEELAIQVVKGNFRPLKDSGFGSPIFWDFVAKSNKTGFMRMKKYTDKHPPIVAASMPEVLSKIQADSSLVYPGQTFTESLVILSNTCDLSFLPERSGAGLTLNSGYVFKKNSLWNKRLGSVFPTLSEMVRFIEQRHVDRLIEQQAKNCGDDSHSQLIQLQLRHFFGLLLCCLLVLGVAITVLAAECGLRCFDRWKYHKWRKQRMTIVRTKLRTLQTLSNASTDVSRRASDIANSQQLDPNALRAKLLLSKGSLT